MILGLLPSLSQPAVTAQEAGRFTYCVAGMTGLKAGTSLLTRAKRGCIISGIMLGGRTNEEWIAQYSSSHQHPVNRLCHTFGIPIIVLSLVLFLISIFVHQLWPYALGMFLFGWALQFIGHAFEHKEPEFFHDWRFLLVGTRWWWAKIRGRA